MDLSKLSQGEKAIAGSAVVLLIASFLPWFKLDLGIAEPSRNGWGNVLSMLGILVGLVMLLQIVLAKFTTTKLPTPPVPWGRVHLILGVAAFALILLQAVVGDSVLGVDLDRAFGLFIGVLAAAGLAYGGFVRSKEPEVTPGFRV